MGRNLSVAVLCSPLAKSIYGLGKSSRWLRTHDLFQNNLSRPMSVQYQPHKPLSLGSPKPKEPQHRRSLLVMWSHFPGSKPPLGVGAHEVHSMTFSPLKDGGLALAEVEHTKKSARFCSCLQWERKSETSYSTIAAVQLLLSAFLSPCSMWKNCICCPVKSPTFWTLRTASQESSGFPVPPRFL
jgi:hypothetical protein